MLNGPDRDGCFSGGVVINNGVPTFIYHGVPEGTCIANSVDDDLIRWTKYPGNPVIPVPKPGSPDFGKYIVYDPCAWNRDGEWYALCGSRDPQGGDTAYLFESPDMIHWEFLNPFYKSDRRWTEEDEDCAVPNFFPIGDKYMLLFCSHLQGTQYYIGRYEGDQFYPESHSRMSWAGGLLGGGITMLDGKGCRIFFDWIREIRGAEAERASGWSGVMTLPRVLSLAEDGILRIEPIPELKILRRNPRKLEDLHLATDSEYQLDGVSGACLELLLEIEVGDAYELGVKVRCSPDKVEQTAVAYVPDEKILKVDMSKSSLDENIRYYYYRNHGALNRLSIFS
jgi:beta-fructofuranosidase